MSFEKKEDSGREGKMTCLWSDIGLIVWKMIFILLSCENWHATDHSHDIPVSTVGAFQFVVRERDFRDDRTTVLRKCMEKYRWKAR